MRKLPLLLTALLVSPLTLADATAAIHFRLDHSSPADEATLEAPPTQVRLWFTQEPRMEGARIALIDANGEVVPTGAVEQGEEDPKMIHAPIEATIGDGEYRIRWRAMAQDGHVVDGDLAFSVASTR